MWERSGREWRFDRWDPRPLISISWTITKTRSFRCDAANVDVHKGGIQHTCTASKSTHLRCHDVVKRTFWVTVGHIRIFTISTSGLTREKHHVCVVQSKHRCQRSTLMYYLDRTFLKCFFFLLCLNVRGDAGMFGWHRIATIHRCGCVRKRQLHQYHNQWMAAVSNYFNPPSLFNYCNVLFFFLNKEEEKSANLQPFAIGVQYMWQLTWGAF